MVPVVSRKRGRATASTAAESARLIATATGMSASSRTDTGQLPYIYLCPDPHGSWPVSVRLLALIPVAVAISLALSAAVDAVALPLFLDTTGTDRKSVV